MGEVIRLDFGRAPKNIERGKKLCFLRSQGVVRAKTRKMKKMSIFEPLSKFAGRTCVVIDSD